MFCWIEYLLNFFPFDRSSTSYISLILSNEIHFTVKKGRKKVNTGNNPNFFTH